MAEALKTAKKRADKEIAHLTYARVGIAPEQKIWHFRPIADAMNEVAGTFLQLVSDKLFGERWNDLKQQRSNAVKEQDGG